MMNANYERAATLAASTLIQYNITATPIAPLHILKRIPDVLVYSFADVGSFIGMERKKLVPLFGENAQDAVTFVDVVNGKPHYIVAYNQQLPFAIVQRSLDRELAHIVLGHDASIPEDVRNEEARCFAHHLTAPRALIYLIKAMGIRFTTEVLGNLTGCYDRCTASMRRLPAVHVPAEMNRTLRAQFMPYVLNFFEYQRVLARDDGSAIADIGSYMDGYEE